MDITHKAKYIRHGLGKHPINAIWKTIKDRCYNPKSKDYKYYGAIGIKMHPSWAYEFKLFYDYVISLDGALKPNLTIDRIKNNKGYFPGNLRWASRHVQVSNQNKKKNNSTGFTGVFRSDKRFTSNIKVNGRYKYLGIFKTPVLAAEARDMYIIKSGLWEYPLQVIKEGEG